MSFLTENDEKKYSGEKVTMLKQKKVMSLDQLVTPEGQINLSIPDVDRIRNEVNNRMVRVSTATEKSYIYLH